jgi:3',5'-cyclic AMP phosphodiesterase CpdA
MSDNRDFAGAAVRLIHFSDIHVQAEHARWQLGDWFSRRTTGWFNLRRLGRGKRFSQASRVLTALGRELQQQRPDRVVFSGDATALGFQEEMAMAARLLGVGGPHELPGLAVPGNHDYYTRSVAGSGLFERYFAPWQKGEREGGATYPFAQRVGPLWLVALNSSTGNRWPWDATGRVGAEQLSRLAMLLRRLDPGPRVLVTHYPICLSSGRPETWNHGLRDLAGVVKVAAEAGVCLWLHGHRHGAYHLFSREIAPFPIICAGTVTQAGRWSYGEYTIAGKELHAVRRRYVSDQDCFQECESFDLHLPG